MKLEQVLSSSDIMDALDAVSEGWEDSMKTFTADRPGFLKPEQIKISLVWARLEDDYEQIVATADKIAKDEALVRLAWHASEKIYTHNLKLQNWPDLESKLGDDKGIFYLLVGLENITRSLKHHWSLGVPESVSRETLQQVGLYCNDVYKPLHGQPGLNFGGLNWLGLYTRELYFRIGRFEYWSKPFRGGLKAYPNR